MHHPIPRNFICITSSNVKSDLNEIPYSKSVPSYLNQHITSLY